MIHMRSNSNTAVCAALLLFAVLFLLVAQTAIAAKGDPRHVSNKELRAEKHGRVVDADTGAGIPGVMLIANWRTDSTGNGWVSGGTWCDLQKIVTTDADGNFSIPDVSRELDLSDRGTKSGLTNLGWLSTTHEKDWVLSTFKLGYVRVSDMDAPAPAGTGRFGGMFWRSPPDVRVFSRGKVEVKPIALRKLQLQPPDLWFYYSAIQTHLGCRDRMSNSIHQPEVSDIFVAMRDNVRPMPCKMPPETVISPEAFDSYATLAHGGSIDLPFLSRVKSLQGIKSTSRLPYDPTERITTTAGILCQVVNEKSASK